MASVAAATAAGPGEGGSLGRGDPTVAVITRHVSRRLLLLAVVGTGLGATLEACAAAAATAAAAAATDATALTAAPHHHKPPGFLTVKFLKTPSPTQKVIYFFVFILNYPIRGSR